MLREADIELRYVARGKLELLAELASLLGWIAVGLLFVDNRGLVMTLWTADALTEEELTETGIIEIDRALAISYNFV